MRGGCARGGRISSRTPRESCYAPGTMPFRRPPPAALMLATLCVVAFGLRLPLFGLHPSIAHPDEVFQYAEQAHRLVYGTGIVPWEFQLGVRSWLIPGLLAGVMQVARVINDDPVVAGWAIAIAMSLIGLLPVICGFIWGRRSAG